METERPNSWRLNPNARCLSEGVDIPALDGVAFIDPRGSEIDIVQAVGRAIRVSSEKAVGTIIIPVFIEEHEDPNVALNNSSFKKVWAVVNALRSHDEEFGAKLDLLRRKLGRRERPRRVDKVYFDLPKAISVDFEESLDVKLVESTTTSWEFWIGLLESYKKEFGHSSPPDSYKTEDGLGLGRWVSTQRKEHRKGKLDPERVRRLDQIALLWEPRKEPTS